MTGHIASGLDRADSWQPKNECRILWSLMSYLPALMQGIPDFQAQRWLQSCVNQDASRMPCMCKHRAL